MLAEFRIVPVGTVSSSVSARVAKVIDIVDKSGLSYKINPMGTVVEGSWDNVFALIKKCHTKMMKGSERAVTTIIIDDRKGQPNRINKKVASVEKKLGKTLKK